MVRGIAYPANAPKLYKSLFHDPEDDIKTIVQTVARAENANATLSVSNP